MDGQASRDAEQEAGTALNRVINFSIASRLAGLGEKWPCHELD
jgi:hypothetical protein